jgi:hypothetical protein
VTAMEEPTLDQVQRELEAARLAIVSLLAVITNQQVGSVETALEALAPMYDAARPALEEIRSQRRRRRATDGRDHKTREAIEAHLTTREETR